MFYHIYYYRYDGDDDQYYHIILNIIYRIIYHLCININVTLIMWPGMLGEYCPRICRHPNLLAAHSLSSGAALAGELGLIGLGGCG